MTLDGKPLHQAGVLFFPAAGNAGTAHAVTNPAGCYTAEVPATQPNVVISLHVEDGKEKNGEPSAEQIVPALYSDLAQSKLHVTPKAGQNTMADFDLPSTRKPEVGGGGRQAVKSLRYRTIKS